MEEREEGVLSMAAVIGIHEALEMNVALTKPSSSFPVLLPEVRT